MNRIASLILLIAMGSLLIIGCGPKETKEQLSARAAEFEKDDNLKEAIIVYEQLIKDYPRTNYADSILFKVGQLYSDSLSEFENAIDAYKRLVKKYPDSRFSAQSLFMIGQMYSNNLLEFDNAIDAHKRLVKKYPDSRFSPQSLFLIGYHYANSISDTAEARKYYEKFLVQYPEHDLANSVRWELDHLGQDINQIDFLKSEKFEEFEQDSGVSNPKNTK